MMTKEERDEIFRRALAGCRPKAPPPKPAPPPANVVAQERWAQPKPREAIAAQAAVSTKALAEQMRQDRQETGDDREYWRVLHAQIDNGGAEAMLYNLGKQWLEGWHPRDIPEALLTNPALQKQKTYNLPPWEQWYVGLLHNGRLPNAPSARPNRSFTRDLFADARAKVGCITQARSSCATSSSTKSESESPAQSFAHRAATVGPSHHWPNAAKHGASVGVQRSSMRRMSRIGSVCWMKRMWTRHVEGCGA